MNNQEPQVNNAADESQVNAAKRRERESARQSGNDMRAVLATAEGRRVLWGFLDSLDLSCVHPSGSQTYFNLGERNLALRIKSEIIKADPKAWIKMQLEQGDF